MKKKILGLCVCLLLIGTAFPVVESLKNTMIPATILRTLTAGRAATVQNPGSLTQQQTETLSIVWDVTMSFSNPTGQNEYVVFGEAPDARDGPPADTYDVAKPPAPMTPYIRAYLKDYNLPVPYTNLWMDYRQYPDADKIWNVSVRWEPEDGESPTTITMSWSQTRVDESEYNYVNLTTNAGEFLKNMLVDTSYTFSCPASVLQNFKIMCSTRTTNQPPNPVDKPTGDTSGKFGVEYSFMSSTTDPDGDQVFYLWDWGDGNNSGWLGPYDSGAICEAKHIWTGKVKTHYNIKAKAKDISGAESDWSDPLPITMPCSYTIPVFPHLELLFERFPYAFPILRPLLGY
jgi:hypothetical protein